MKLSIRPAVTLDGFIADLDGDCYSWIVPEDEERFESELLASGCELVGGKTYQQYKDNYDTRTKVMTFVYTRSSKQDTKLIKFVQGDLKEVLSNIAESYDYEEVLVSGGGELNGALAAANLVDELYISFHPIMLGEGIKVFGDYKLTLKLELIDSNTDINNVVRCHYRVSK